MTPTSPGSTRAPALRRPSTGVTLGSVMAEVTVSVAGGDMVAAITRKSADRLQLAAGDEVVVLTKATEVMLAT